MEGRRPNEGTHSLETAEGGSIQDVERKRLSKGYSLPGDRTGRDKSEHSEQVPNEGHSQTGDHRGRDKSGHGKKATERGALTVWIPRREGQVRT